MDKLWLAFSGDEKKIAKKHIHKTHIIHTNRQKGTIHRNSFVYLHYIIWGEIVILDIPSSL